MDRSSLRRTYDTTKRTKYIALAAGAVAFVVLWIIIIVWLGKVGSAEPSKQAASSAPATTTQQAPQAPEAPQTTTEQETDQEGGGADGSGAADGDEPAETLGGGAENSAEVESQTEQFAGGGIQPGEVFDPLEEDNGTAVTGDGASEAPESVTQTDPQTESPTEPVVSTEPAEDTADTERTGGTEDTADTGRPADASAIPDTDLTRARTASERYLTAAYGYTGTSAEDYLRGIEEAASEEVFDSPGGGKLEGYSEAAPACGMVSTVILDEFEVIGNGPDGLDTLATFSVEDADGQTHRFSQEHRLSSSEGVYQVVAVSVEELISDTTLCESCPGSDSESLDDESAASGEDSGEAREELGVGRKEQVRSAADRFITAAYGYTGDSGKQYREGIERTTVSGRFFESPGGGRIDGYAETAGEEGIEAAAKMERFEITGVSREEVEGVAYFEVGSSYDRYANVEGETASYRQRLSLSPYEGSYRVLTAAAQEEIDDSQATGRDDERKLTR